MDAASRALAQVLKASVADTYANRSEHNLVLDEQY